MRKTVFGFEKQAAVVVLVSLTPSLALALFGSRSYKNISAEHHQWTTRLFEVAGSSSNNVRKRLVRMRRNVANGADLKQVMAQARPLVKGNPVLAQAFVETFPPGQRDSALGFLPTARSTARRASPGGRNVAANTKRKLSTGATSGDRGNKRREWKPAKRASPKPGSEAAQGDGMNPAVVITNLPYKATEADVSEYLQSILTESIESLRICFNRRHSSSGTAFLRLMHPGDANSVMAALTAVEYDGRRLSVGFEHGAANQEGYLVTAYPEGDGIITASQYEEAMASVSVTMRPTERRAFTSRNNRVLGFILRFGSLEAVQGFMREYRKVGMKYRSEDTNQDAGGTSRKCKHRQMRIRHVRYAVDGGTAPGGGRGDGAGRG